MNSLTLMPSKLKSNREDELWASQEKSELKYCCKHKRFYKAEIGCQFCNIAKKKTILNLHREEHIDVPVLKCPRCRKKSLYWIEQIQVYECLNIRCRISYKQVQYEESLQCDNQT